MHILGIIVEYNPFHNGHLYHIHKAKELTGADYVIAVTSGDFLQRGAPALLCKYKRTEMALLNGVDMVIQLPVCYATSSAENFALAAIDLLNSLTIVDSICFGSESGEISYLYETAKTLIDEPEDYRIGLKEALKKGYNFPTARSRALISYLSKKHPKDTLDKIHTLLTSPNNILGIEYLKALIKTKSTIKPYTITRATTGYHDTTLKHQIASATAIRNSLEQEDDITHFQHTVPNPSYQIIQANYKKNLPIFINDYTLLLYAKLMQLSEHELMLFEDVNHDLAYRIKSCGKEFQSLTELAEKIKSKSITLTRVYRALFHILLGITKDSMAQYAVAGYSQYIRILGFRTEASILFKNIKQHSPKYLIGKLAMAKDDLSPLGKSMLEQDLLASDLYRLVAYNKFGTHLPSDFKQGILRI